MTQTISAKTRTLIEHGRDGAPTGSRPAPLPLSPKSRADYLEKLPVDFDPASSALRPQSVSVVLKLAKAMNERGSALRHFEVAGYADATPWRGYTPEDSANKNKDISQQRAKVVYDFLVGEGKVDPARLTFIGHGQSDFRRVQIKGLD